MDNKEDALGKLSRQLASMCEQSNEMTSDGAAMWTPFSGITAPTTDVPFSNLYSWNSMDSPDFDPLTPTEGEASIPTYLDISERSLPGEIGSNQMHLHHGLDPQRFVYHDTAGRRNHSEGYDSHTYSFIGQNNIHSGFQYKPINTPTPLHQLSQPLTQNHSINSDLHRTFTPPSSIGNSIFLNNRLDGAVPQTGFSYSPMPEETSFGMGTLPNIPRIGHSPLFDPCISMPPLNLPMHGLENTSSLSPKATYCDTAHFLNAPSISVDSGIKSNERQSEADGFSLSTEEEKVLQASKKRWHSLESNVVTSSKASESATTDTQKPSYSDIAKTPKQSKSDPSSATETVNKIQAPKQAKKESKPLRPPVKRTSSGSKFWPKPNHSTEAEPSKTSASSRYGLDNFNEHVFSPGSVSSSSENLTSTARSRAGSGSSAEGSPIVPEDHVHSTKISFSDTNLLHHSPEQKSDKAFKGPTSAEHVFFDPRRIFQSKPNNKSRSQAQAKSKDTNVMDHGKTNSETVLNNGKPTASNSSSKLPSSAKQHDYINNDLRDASKLTNQISAESGHSSLNKNEESLKTKEMRQSKRSAGRAGGVYRRPKSSENGHTESEVSREDGHLQQATPGFLTEFLDREKIEEFFHHLWETFTHYGKLLMTSLIHVLILLFSLILYVAAGGIRLSLWLMATAWSWLKLKFSKEPADSKGNPWNARDFLRRRVGLEENITLPSTGEEAMKRLLACKGKDPYSILGLRVDSSDEDIKKYYRKQAVLVHPDKNQEPGAEEAFKILGHAFEMIGDATKRKAYDSHTQEANEAEAMREFAEMLSKLQAKIQEAANIMPCDNCEGKHQRFPVERPFYSARFCQRCNVFHAAKEGDVWAETTMLGFKWNYYALMENRVYDITQWMACHKEYFKHMKPNYHGVTYRIATDGSKKNKRQAGEPSLEDFINHLINKSAAASEGHNSSWGQGHSPGDDGSWNHGNPSAAAAKQKGRRKKKRN